MASTLDILTIRLVCKKLPGLRFEDPSPQAKPVREPVYLGIQKGQDVIHITPADRRQVTFQAAVRISQKKDGSLNFLGPYTYGSSTQRFLYLSWGEQQPDGTYTMFRRAKIHLSHLSWHDVSKALNANTPLTAELTLTDSRGGPLCASVDADHIQWRLS